MRFNSAKLAALMREHNETAYRLSKELGISQTTVKNWLDGSNVPQLAKLSALADHYGAPQEAFFEQVEPAEEVAAG